MSRCRVTCLSIAALAIVASAVPPAFAQPLGTFRWRLAPFCNVVTLDAVLQSTTITVSGSDDQCGGTVAAAVSGTAHTNPSGSISLSLLVTRPDGITLSSTIDIDVVTLSGVWRDDSGNSGAFLFNPAAAPGDLRRMTVKGVYSAGFIATEPDDAVLSNFSFGRTLPAAPSASQLNIIPFGAAPTVNCPGTFDNPRAIPGQLCLYERFRLNVSSYAVSNSAAVADVADTIGAHFVVFAEAAGATSLTGAWAVTIP